LILFRLERDTYIQKVKSKMNKEKVFTTNDIGLAAYLLMKGVSVKSVQNSRPFLFVFLNEKDVCEQYSIDYLNSESSRFDDSMKKIKLILKNSKQ